MSTRRHYEKYEELSKKLNVTVHEDYLQSAFDVKNKKHLLLLFTEDPDLNNIPLHIFDNLYFYLRSIRRDMGISMAECCFLYKHLLIYHVLGIPAPKWVADDLRGMIKEPHDYCPECGASHAVECTCHSCGYQF